MREHYRIKATVEAVQWEPNHAEERGSALDWLRKYAAEFKYDESSGELYFLSHGRIVEMAHGDWFVRGHQGFIFRKTNEELEEEYEWAPPWFIFIEPNYVDHCWHWACTLGDCASSGDAYSTAECHASAREHVRKVHP